MGTSANLTDAVKERIRAEIISGRLAFGVRLRIDELAGRYQSSHMPVREALRSLAGEGLVVAQANRGACVVNVDRHHVEQVFTIRMALEVALARQAAPVMTPATLDELTALEGARLACVERGDYAESVAINHRFHRRIYETAGNAEALLMVDRHWFLLAALWSRFGYQPDRLGGVANDHDHILRALRDKDAEAAGIVTAAHVIKARQNLVARMAPVNGTRS